MLRQLGAPHSVISSALTHFPFMFNRKHDIASGQESRMLLKWGSNLLFFQALRAIDYTSKSRWEGKVNVYKSWGLSNDDIFSAFKKNPLCMMISEKKISSAMDFFVNKMDFPTSTIVKNPTILGYSLEKRVVPRSRVYRILQLKGLMEKEISLHTFLQPAEEQFLNKFVSPYTEQVPHLLDIYKGRMRFSQLDF